jgi:hypothetical protein
MMNLVGLYNGAVLEDDIVIGTQTMTFWSTAYHVTVPDVKKDDLLIISAEEEVEMTVTYNTEVVSQVVLSDGWCSNDVDAAQYGFMPVPIIGSNLTNNPIHYEDISRSAQMIMPRDMASACFQFRVRCRSTSASGNDKAKNKHYGHLTISVWRNEEVVAPPPPPPDSVPQEVDLSSLLDTTYGAGNWSLVVKVLPPA